MLPTSIDHFSRVGAGSPSCGGWTCPRRGRTRCLASRARASAARGWEPLPCVFTFPRQHVPVACPSNARAALSWLIEGRFADGVRGPATVGFLLVAAGLAACHFVDCLAEGWVSGRWPGRARLDVTERGVCVSADPVDPADLGNDSLPDAVVEHLRNDALRSDIFDGFDPPFATEKVPQT